MSDLDAQVKAALRRWRDILAYALAGAFIFEIALPFGAKLFARLVVPAAYASWFVFLAAAVSLVVIAFVISEPIRIRRGHWQHVHRYPPLWFSLVLALVIVLIFSTLPSEIQPLYGPIKDKDVSLAWKTLVAKTIDPDSIQRLLDVLGIKQVSSGLPLIRSGTYPQSIEHDDPSNYFRRIQQGRLAPGETGDQEVLADIEQWKRKHGGTMFTRLISEKDNESRYVKIWEYHAWRMEDADLF